ncbi:MAG: response regulator, partial [Bacteroidota bacterium]
MYLYNFPDIVEKEDSPTKILLVDDEQDVEGLVKLKFRRQIREGIYQFVFAKDGKDALEKLDLNPDIDIVISDINMPEMDGLTLLDRLNNLDRTLKAIIVSAYGDMDNIRTAMNRGAYDFITKPINFEDLNITIEKTRKTILEIKENLFALRTAEENLKDTMALNHAIIDSAADTIISLDLNGTIESVNKAGTEMFGFGANDLIGKHLSTIVDDSFYTRLQAYIRDKNSNSGREFISKRHETIGITKTGFKLDIEAAVSEFKMGSRRMINIILHDITIRKKAELLLKEYNVALENEVNERTKELVKLNNEKNEILGIAAHDLKNPLSNIKMLAKLIKEDTSMTPDDINEFSTDILTASERMFELIKNLLDVNAIEQGKINLNPESFHLQLLINPQIEYFREQAKQKNITIHYNEGNKPVPLIYADRNAVNQIIENLISNAVKYSPLGSSVWVNINPGDKEIVLEVKDEGPGISTEEQSKLFKKFSRLSTLPTGGEHSTGLGLSIVKKLI